MQNDIHGFRLKRHHKSILEDASDVIDADSIFLELYKHDLPEFKHSSPEYYKSIGFRMLRSLKIRENHLYLWNQLQKRGADWIGINGVSPSILLFIVLFLFLLFLAINVPVSLILFSTVDNIWLTTFEILDNIPTMLYLYWILFRLFRKSIPETKQQAAPVTLRMEACKVRYLFSKNDVEIEDTSLDMETLFTGDYSHDLREMRSTYAGIGFFNSKSQVSYVISSFLLAYGMMQIILLCLLQKFVWKNTIEADTYFNLRSVSSVLVKIICVNEFLRIIYVRFRNMTFFLLSSPSEDEYHQNTVVNSVEYNEYMVIASQFLLSMLQGLSLLLSYTTESESIGSDEHRIWYLFVMIMRTFDGLILIYSVISLSEKCDQYIDDNSTTLERAKIDKFIRDQNLFKRTTVIIIIQFLPLLAAMAGTLIKR